MGFPPTCGGRKPRARPRRWATRKGLPSTSPLRFGGRTHKGSTCVAVFLGGRRRRRPKGRPFCITAITCIHTALPNTGGANPSALIPRLSLPRIQRRNADGALIGRAAGGAHPKKPTPPTVGSGHVIIPGTLCQGCASRPDGAPLTQRAGYDGGNYANNATFCAFLRVFCAFWVDLLQKTCISPTLPALAPKGEGAQLRASIISRSSGFAACQSDGVL